MTATTFEPGLMPSIVRPPTVTFHPAGEPTPAALSMLTCPNCGDTQPKSLVLVVDIDLPDNPSRHLKALHCPGCTAHFYDNQEMPNYAEPALNERGRVPFYVQQGAGVSLITRPLAQLRRPAGAAYMEIGCGYGFGLDFALNTRGWQGRGIDPAPLAALGRDALGLPIELRYLRDDDEARGTMDIVLGSEVIEHVPSPAAFVRTLRAMLKPGGILALTTPNGEDIAPSTAPGILIPLLSPTLHLVIQNRHSLGTLLRQAGFAHVQVGIDSHSLVAFASDAPLDLETDNAALRVTYRAHLQRRAEAVDAGSDLLLAYAGRAFQESVNDGDMAAADRAWVLLVPACRARFGFDLDGLAALPGRVATCELEEMARLVPLNLGGLLYGRAVHRLAAGTPRPELEAQFLLASSAARQMRRALGELAMEDGQTEDIGWTAFAEAMLCAAEADDPTLAERYEGLPPAPNGGQLRRQRIALRAISHLVNRGHYASATAFADRVDVERLLTTPRGGALPVEERDALFCLAVIDVRPPGHPARGGERFAAARAATPPGTSLWFSALRGELQAADALGDTARAQSIIAELRQPGLTDIPEDLLARMLGR